MKMKDWPTLFEIRDMLGKDLYVDFVWMWRDNAQNIRAARRRAEFPVFVPHGNVDIWPTPMFAHTAEGGTPASQEALNVLPLRAPRLGEGSDVGAIAHRGMHRRSR